MLASLLPGLRDVRVPLTVGYLWLYVGWLLLAGNQPDHRPVGDGLVARTYDLLDALGPAAGIAALSFAAYVLGALLAVSTENRLAERLLGSAYRFSADARQTAEEYPWLLKREGEAAFEHMRGLPPPQFDKADSEAHQLSQAGVAVLRPRLLVANQQLYGEYDRLASEAAFRLNLVAPLTVLTVVAGFGITSWALVGLVGPVVLGVQGMVRLTLAKSVIQRAVLSGVIVHPLTAWTSPGDAG